MIVYSGTLCIRTGHQELLDCMTYEVLLGFIHLKLVSNRVWNRDWNSNLDKVGDRVWLQVRNQVAEKIEIPVRFEIRIYLYEIS